MGISWRKMGDRSGESWATARAILARPITVVRRPWGTEFWHQNRDRSAVFEGRRGPFAAGLF